MAISRAEKSRCVVQNLTTAVLTLAVCSACYVVFSAMKDSGSFPNNGFWTSLYDGFHFSKKDGQLPKDKLLGGLLAEGIDENSCASRHQSVLYQKQQVRQASSHLISRLRNYETLHKKCGPNTESYNKTLEVLKSGQYNETATTEECRYVVWIAISGLGNKMLSLASAFLYALLTNRVLLVDGGGHILDLFCEPFPEVSWLLREDFPIIDKLSSFNQTSPHSYGNLLRQENENQTLGPFVYLHLLHDYDDHDKLFFCEKAEMQLKRVPWLIMKSNNYFLPSLFLIPSFSEELDELFPEKDAVFHLLGRYLLHPENSVWGLITRYYDAYLARADEKIGIQVRVLDPNPGPLKNFLDQILACVIQEKILPKVKADEQISINASRKVKTKAVLLTSLNSGYLEPLRNMYWENSTSTGEVIEVFQPSHEEYEQTEKLMHSKKALAEMYLLSMTDKVVTSSWSTFGYVAQSLGGLKPWILSRPENQTAPDPPCRRGVSMEPCFHAPPPHDSGWCGNGKSAAYVQPCEDRSWGIKLVGKDGL